MGRVIGLTYDLKTDWPVNPDDPVDASAELDKPQTIDRIEAALQKGGHTVQRIGNVFKLLAQIEQLDVDLVFNICEGRRGRNRESQVPVILEMRDIPFVGSDGLTLGITLDKVVAKRMFISDGLPTPRFFTANNVHGLEGLNHIGFPLIVKATWEGTSKGLSVRSRVEDWAGLTRQVDLITRQYHQPALVEEFIRGREFTVPVLGNENPQAMPVVQVEIDGKTELGDEFFTFERVVGGGVNYLCPAKISEDLTRRIQAMAVRAYASAGCRDFGRVDFRVDEQGNPYILEINPLPSLAEADVFNLFPRAIGSNFERVLNQIDSFALERYGMAGEKKGAKEGVSVAG